jgi:hypothetical protein
MRNKYDIDLIKSLCDGKLSSYQIADKTGYPAKYIQRAMLKFDLPRLKSGPPRGKRNPSWRHGRHYSRDGYCLIPAPEGHPYARKAKRKNIGRILEHRHVVEQALGRYLTPKEVVHHLNGCTLDNRLENLEVFSSNGEHLKIDLSGKCPNWSEEGKAKLRLSNFDKINSPRVDTHNPKKKQGEIRRRQILLARELLGKDSPYLLGTEQYLDDN